MKPDFRSTQLLSMARSKAKMYEYEVPLDDHISLTRDPARLFTLAVGLLGDFAARSSLEPSNAYILDDARRRLEFSSRFFDAYIGSKLDSSADPYVILLGSAAYYLSEFPGSSTVLANHISFPPPNLGGLGLEKLLHWILQGDFSKPIEGDHNHFKQHIDSISLQVHEFYAGRIEYVDLRSSTKNLRDVAYHDGTPRQLLLAYLITAIVNKRIENSCRYCLPRYSNISLEKWEPALQKASFLQELWPAQHLLGSRGVYQGDSAIIQMPTSAGKTRAIELVLRSVFLSNQSTLAVIVSPFRALCHEIRINFSSAFSNEPVFIEEFSDVLQTDFEVQRLLGRNQIVIVTPEKFLYVLRHYPEIAENLDVLVLDEGHQFDNGIRGISFGLLVSALNPYIPRAIQTLLISAVISNGAAVADWLLGNEALLISGQNLSPTFRTLGFASWKDKLGRLEFVSLENPEDQDFFVPRVIEQQVLKLRARERKERFFPERNDGKGIGAYLGLKLVSNGSVAIYCGTKASVNGVCKTIIDAYDRGLDLPEPIEYSDQSEISRLGNLYEKHLGFDASVTKCAKMGVLSHHGNTPHGIRLAVEYAISVGLANYVVCTSTLAQGVNLPIRYLVVTGIYQGIEKIKVRDFHNLIGRAGRSGMHTEGSILFSHPNIYDERRAKTARWNSIKELLDPENSEPCGSTLLSFFDRLESDDARYSLKIDPFNLLDIYLDAESDFDGIIQEIVTEHGEKRFSKYGLARQLRLKTEIVSGVESYLMAYWDDYGLGEDLEEVQKLAKDTLAYYLADNEIKEKLIELFKKIASNIAEKIPNSEKRKLYGRTLFGVQSCSLIEDWLNQNISQFTSDESTLLDIVWPLLNLIIRNNSFQKIEPADVLLEVAKGWISGIPHHEILRFVEDHSAKLIAGSQRRKIVIEHIVDVCENALGFEGAHILGALVDILGANSLEEYEEFAPSLTRLQKMLKYGLPSPKSIGICELGFFDRVFSQELGAKLDMEEGEFRGSVLRAALRELDEDSLQLFDEYPRFFKNIFETI